MAGDDDARNGRALLVSVKNAGNGMLRIVLDRVSLRPDGLWEQRTGVSYKDFPEEEIREMAMPEGDVLSLGSFVLAELGASLEERS